MRRFCSTAPPDEVARSPAPTTATLRGAKNGFRSWGTALPRSSKPQDHRHVVGALHPTARGLEDLGAGDLRHQRRRHPDVVEAAAAVGGIPVLGAVAPPRIKLLLRRDHVA